VTQFTVWARHDPPIFAESQVFKGIQAVRAASIYPPREPKQSKLRAMFSKRKSTSGKAMQRGFNLIELLIVIALGAVLLAVGIPSITTLAQNGRLVTQSNILIATLNNARGEALKENVQVTTCKSNDNTTCNNSLNWDDGWISFVDNDGDGERDTGGTPEELLWAQSALEGSNSLTSTAFDNFIAFAPNGMTIGSSANAGSFRLCDSRGMSNARDIGVTRTGSSSVNVASGGDC
jgi:type IV fimbrial biogenesis protein FimT